MKETRPKILKGIIVSDKMEKTRVVEVERYFKMPKYGKYIKRSKKFKAHDENNEYKSGEKVKIQETRPISRDKRWKIISRI
ncbi:30S ribosomal protein S17 [Candidatus Giovannonibacteria bacterium RIFCSPLOWO2_02_FULL_43_11b]|uniref:Small ribosomal subunit protein uS17 n=1 Tax=Candidatus Giovannonibacteria bacterium RIFCSPHIGHO2_12_FULL_43_15 TaxID=1798341 RepID=A0A1F5WR49_9BACT|nr:MAG: 30S ribosomal protein S17 [Candidatus Giovannonibacteria bacterium RIFCSPHIGHO2_01_FULL_43_100]OGF66964.1 MAG: 30S ribosomal protein S17 [Candidatus Giovannonibacteria bacterium RIFCSPHIGHO2_02_FULL_43_32]OGF78145.1 MAG: 30S ribosomal protein S17 [Candidatus Giovannonibacteria bacterium RIFCSPHIGHO2_12_FULL_43_15]OGF78552.1 MAG: 30S ribosomal protein S17 [Candidatus Giovannonibacteria bacterium RIFCSPLOWO2_01_FULL_43_60]OGF89867.1 MAG: 30S ribosomal protein S17 [Candidatus Giovannonibac